MRKSLLPSAVFAALFAAFSLHGAETSPFANFAGRYSKHGLVNISDGHGTTATGKARQTFHVAASGESARLKITGSIKLGGATRPFTVTYIFKRRDADGIDVAAISNLAPGLDDGHATDNGAYNLGPRTILAEAPFVSGTTTGTASLFVRLKKRPRGTLLFVRQMLSSSALTHPITWTFKALSQR